jgi:TonB family protein
VTLLIGLAIRSSVLLAAGLLLSASLSKRSAALRHRVLSASLLAAAIVTPLSLALPHWDVTLPANALFAASPLPPAAATESTAPATAAPSAPVPRPPASTPQHLLSTLVHVGRTTLQHPAAPLLLWRAGVLLAMGVLARRVLHVGRLTARASRVDDERWLQILQTVAAHYRLSRPVVISRTDSADLLGTWGILRPQVLVPSHASDWTLDRVHVVLCHELAHIRRRDWLVQLGAETLRAILWFSPLAWIICTRLRRESEQACDDEVLGMGVRGGDYAAHLLELVRQCRPPGSTWASAIPMAHPSTLERRIAAMLNPRLDRHAPSLRAMLALTIVLLLVAVPAAVLRGRQAGPAPLSGTVYDVSGGVMPGVQVALVDATQSRWTATSDASGRFALPAVGPGKYVLEATLPGFRALRQEFELRNPRDWDRAVTLQVGDLRESVTVRETRTAASTQAAPVTVTSQPVRVGGNVRAPRKERDVRPIYPASMRDAGLTGVVPIEAVIGRDGTVSSVRVISAQVHPDFAIAAVDAVRQWRFTPTLLNGVPVEVVMTVTVQFDLD